jgi:Domain of unknown function (DUF6916)
MLDSLEESSFKDRLQETFTVEVGDGEVEMQLIEVTASSEKTQMPDRRRPFSIVFLAAGGEVLPQSIYRVRNPALGEVEIFLVPLGPDVEHKGIRHEAVFT